MARRIWNGVVLAAAISQACWGQSAFAQDDDTTTVTGVHAMRVGSYKAVNSNYDWFDHLPSRDRRDLSLHFLGKVLPGNELPSTAHVVIHAKSGDIPLFVGEDREMRFPRSSELLAENPAILLTLPPGKKVQMEVALEVAPLPTPSFTKEQAQGWLREVDGCIENIVGVVLAFLAPDAHRLKIDIAPGARLEAVQGGQTTMLFENRETAPQTYLLHPQDFAAGTVFRSDKPFVLIRVKLPGGEHFVLRRKG